MHFREAIARLPEIERRFLRKGLSFLQEWELFCYVIPHLFYERDPTPV